MSIVQSYFHADQVGVIARDLLKLMASGDPVTVTPEIREATRQDSDHVSPHRRRATGHPGWHGDLSLCLRSALRPKRSEKVCRPSA